MKTVEIVMTPEPGDRVDLCINDAIIESVKQCCNVSFIHNSVKFVVDYKKLYNLVSSNAEDVDSEGRPVPF